MSNTSMSNINEPNINEPNTSVNSAALNTDQTLIKSSNATASFDDFFALFEQPVAFDIDMAQLDTKLRELQQQFHPDQSNDVDVQQSQQQSALINHAYNTLRYPDNRANYLLELAGQEMNLNASIADLDFLDNTMALRIRLDEASTVETLQTLKSELQPNIDKQSIRFKQAYEHHKWDDAVDATQKLRFLINIQKDIDNAIDTLHQSNASDDDLYL